MNSGDIATQIGVASDEDSIRSIIVGMRDSLISSHPATDRVYGFTKHQGYYWDKWRQMVWYSVAPLYFCGVMVEDSVTQARRAGKEISAPLFLVVGDPTHAKAVIDASTSIEAFITRIAKATRKETVGDKKFERDFVTSCASRLCANFDSMGTKSNISTELHAAYHSHRENVNKIMGLTTEKQKKSIIQEPELFVLHRSQG